MEPTEQAPERYSSDQLALVYDKLCDRRESTNVLLWQVPTLSLTAQAFLLSVSLDGGISTLGRFLTATIGSFAAVATCQLFARHRFLEERMSVMLDELESEANMPPAHQPRTFTKRLLATSKPFKESSGFRYLFRKTKSHGVWLVVLGGIAVVDMVIMVLLGIELAGGPNTLL